MTQTLTAHRDLLDLAETGQRILLLLPSMTEASATLARLAETVDAEWSVSRAAGRYRLEHPSGGWLRIHTVRSSSLAFGMSLDHIRAIAAVSTFDQLRAALMPSLLATGGTLDLLVEQ